VREAAEQPGLPDPASAEHGKRLATTAAPPLLEACKVAFARQELVHRRPCVDLHAHVDHRPGNCLTVIRLIALRQLRYRRDGRGPVYGLAYKPNTSDARETPSRPVIDGLVALGADICLVDPHVAASQFPPGVTRCDGNAADLADADLVVYLVNHDDFDHSTIVGSGVVVLDCQHALQGPNVQHL